jgi:hypothetical protein
MLLTGPERFPGAVALIWYVIVPGARPEKLTTAVWFPRFTTGVMAVYESGFGGPGCPEGTAGATTPTPVAVMVKDCPARIGFEALIGLPAASNTPYVPGSCARIVSFRGLLELLPLCTTKSTVLTLGISKGTCTLTWLGET